MASPTQITIQASAAINLSNLADKGSSATKVNLSPGKFAVTLSNDNMQFKANTPVLQVIIFNCSPLQTKSYESWFSTVDASGGTVLTAAEGQPLYVFIVDHMSISDNTGKATVTFTPLF
jgi:hypothetical protein